MKKIIFLLLIALSVSATAFAQTASDTAKVGEASVDAPKQRRKAFRPTKDQIEAAQTFLKTQNLYTGEPTGKYDPAFRKAIREYQGANGLAKSGRLNRATLEKMGIELTEEQAAEPAPPDSYAGEINKANDAGKAKPKRKVFRATKDQITAAQEKLKAAGLYSGEATGKYTEDLRAAVKQYQEANGLRKTGGLTRETVEKLGIELTDNQKGMESAGTGDKASSSRKGRRIFRASRDQITAAQRILIGRGDLSGDTTGKLDDATRDALKKYQEANGLKATGTLNRVTLEKMGIELTDKQKQDAAAEESAESGDGSN
jgi:peptidoglycan hydrolase-like protein with peptidoglycan-binding domain